MRYGMLALYSTIIQALGMLVFFGSLGVGGWLIVSLLRQPRGYSQAEMATALGGTIVVAFGSLAYAAYGQLLMVWMDTERNTRLAIRTPALDRLYEDD